MFTSHKASRLLLVPGTALGIVAALALSSLALDSEHDSEPRVFPYSGFIGLDGEGFDGPVDLTFELRNTSEASLADCQVSETHFGVLAQRGAFQVNLGARTDGGAPDCIFDAEAMFLEVGVRRAVQDPDDPNAPDFAQLTGLQRVFPTAASYWAAEGESLQAVGELVVGEAIQVNSLNADGGFSVGGPVTANGVGILGTVRVDGSTSFTSTNLTRFNGDLQLNSGLALQGNTAFSEGVVVSGDVQATRILGVSSLNHNRTITTPSDVTVGGHLTIGSTGGFSTPGHVSAVNADFNGTAIFGDEDTDLTTLNGRVNIENCRLCLRATDNNGSQAGFSCIRLVDDEHATMRLRGDVDGNDAMQLIFECNGQPTESRNVGG